MVPIRLGLVIAAALTARMAAGQAPLAPKTLEQTEPLVREALATLLKVPASSLTVVDRESRVWPDAAFGCAPQKGVFEPRPTPGYLFTLAHAGRTYEYRTDRLGHVRRCIATAPPRKPIAPVATAPTAPGAP